MKNLLLFCLSFITFYSFAIPPTPNETSLIINAGSDVIVEATVSKIDTINVSENESYFLYSFDIIHILKDRKTKISGAKTVHVLMKRDIEWEHADLSDSYNDPFYLRVGIRAVFFLKENIYTVKGLNPDKPYFLLYSRFYQERIEFTKSILVDFDASGLGLTFTTLQDMYQFIKLLPETSVPNNLTDRPQNKWWEQPYEPYKDSTVIKEMEYNRKLREETQKLYTPSREKILQEKIKQIQKKSQNKRSKKVVTLNVKLTNPTFVYGSLSIKLEFDVQLAASENIYLDNFLMRLKYNPAAFGVNIAQKGAITVSKAPAFNTGYYIDPNAYMKDVATDVIAIPFGLSEYTTSPVTRNQVGTTFTNFLKVSILISDCSKMANISFTDINITKSLNYYISNNPAPYLNGSLLDVTNYIGIINPAQLCKPNILTVDPTTVTAGTNSKITITGFGFGNTKGNGAVVFKNADKLSFDPILTNDNIDVISWSDSKIEYIVPSNIDNKGTSGTGNIAILENTGKVSVASTDIIEVPYSISNFISNGKKYPVIHAETPSGTPGKITFYVTQEIFNNKPYFNLLKRAVDDISCATTVNFELSSTPVANTKTGLFQDGISIISLADDYLFDQSSTLMTTRRYPNKSCTKGNLQWYSSSESDIIIKRSVKWSTKAPEEDLPLNEYDFYQSVLHELGHAAGLGHVVSNFDLMGPSASKGSKYSFLRFSYDNNPYDPSINGVQWLINEANKYDNNGSTCVGVKFMTRKQNCSAITSLQHKQVENNYFKLQNNPVNDDKAIILIGPNYQNTNFNYEIINYQGKTINNGFVSANSNIEIPMEGLAPNLYLIIISDVSGNKKTLKVLKQ